MSEAEDKRRTTFGDIGQPSERGMSEKLDPTTAPAEAVEWYLKHREPELSTSSRENQRYRLNRFIEWAEEIGLEDMADLRPRLLARYRLHRSEQVKPVTLAGELQTLRVFLEFCASIEAAPDGLREHVQIPKLDQADETRDELLESDRADDILDRLERFAYASREHVILSLLWHTGVRLGTLRAIDVDDVDLERESIRIRHRPDSGTPLKNGKAAQRLIAIGRQHVNMLDDYLAHNRPDTTDEYGREPLIATHSGRAYPGTIRNWVYSATQPCEFGECPHDIDPADCEYRNYGQGAGCPSSRSPHGIRRGAITHHLRTGVPLEVVSDRMNASDDVLETHYDKRTERERMERRREFINALEKQGGR